MFRRSLLIATTLLATGALAQNKGTRLNTNDFLDVGEYIVSNVPDRYKHFLVMQGDGNLCLYKGTGPSDQRGYVWCSMAVPGPGQYYAVMQGDGNFCVYRGKGAERRDQGLVWCTYSQGAWTFKYYAIVDVDAFTVFEPKEMRPGTTAMTVTLSDFAPIVRFTTRR